MVVELADHIATITKFPSAESRKIALAVDEAITNVIKHSYQNEVDKDIKLEFYCSSEGMKVRIIFSGVPPVLEQVGVDLDQMIKEKKKGGLGVELMRRIMDSVEYKIVENFNMCEMIKWKKKRAAL